MNLSTIVMFLIIIFLPRLIMLIVSRSRIMATLGPVFLCYLLGLVLSFPMKAWGADMALASDFSSVLVCVAMPSSCFCRPSRPEKLARPMAVSFTMNTISLS